MSTTRTATDPPLAATNVPRAAANTTLAATRMPRTATDTSPAVQRWRYPVLLLLLAMCVAVSALPTPLYALYAETWQYPPVMTTVVFAAYAAGALTAVLISGPLSDRFGRRPVLLIALVLILVGLAVFVTAGSVAFLIVARLVHGLGIGAVVVAAGAALLDLRPQDAARTGTRNAIAFNLGITAGSVGAAALAQADLAPLVSPFLIAAALAVVLLVVVLAMREPRSATPGKDRGPLRFSRPGVPAQIRPRFVVAATSVCAAWTVLGVFLSLEPGIATTAAHATGPLFAGVMVGTFAGAAALAQVIGSRFAARSVALVGDAMTAVMLIACLGAFAIGNPALILVGAALLGGGYGLAFGGSLRYLTADVPSQHRGAVMSAFYLVAYGAMTVPTLLAGIAATVWSPTAVLAPFSIAAAVLSAMAAGAALRARRTACVSAR